MNLLIIGLIFLVIILLTYLNYKVSLKSSMMNGNMFIQSETTSKVIDEMRKNEETLQEKRLLKNARYKAMRTAMSNEISELKSMQLSEIKVRLQNSNPLRKEISIDGYQLQLTIKGHLESGSSPALHLTATPNFILGFLFSIDEWIYFERS